MSSERRVKASGLRGWGGLDGLLGENLDEPEALLEAVERAADREELLREALRIAGVGAWELDPASQTLSWSDETFRIFGLEPGSVTPSNQLFYSIVQEDDRERMLSRQSLSYETGAIFDEEYRIVRPDGELRYLNSRAQIVRRGKDRHNRFLGIVRDVTERRVFEQKLEAERALAQKLQSDLIHISRVSAMDTMSSAMAHELNQPLTSISNYSSAIGTMLRKGADPAALSEILVHLQESAHRAAAIVRRLREMTTRGEVRRDPVLLQECVREATALAVTGSAVHIVYNVPPDIRVKADRIQLQQVIVNLVRNAVEAIGDRRDGKVDLAAWPEKDWVRIRVHDNGSGIPADVLPTIFDSFMSTKPRGMGVGLPISRTIIESHGGELTVASVPGEGTTFEILLPGA